MPHVLAAGAVDGLLLLLFAVLGFGLVAVVAAIVLALIHAVLPGDDSGAEAAHRAAQERADAEGREEAARFAVGVAEPADGAEADGPPAPPEASAR